MGLFQRSCHQSIMCVIVSLWCLFLFEGVMNLSSCGLSDFHYHPTHQETHGDTLVFANCDDDSVTKPVSGCTVC